MLGADIMKRIHGNEDPDHLVPTEVEHIYKTDRALFPYVYLNGFYYFEMNPWAMYEFGFRNEYAMKPSPDMRMSFKTSIEQMTKRFDSYASNEDWSMLFGCIDKKIGLSMFVNHMGEMSSDKLYDAFIEIYQRSEFGFEVLADKYDEIFSFAPYSKARAKRLKKLKRKINDAPEIVIYHGHKRADDPHNPQDHYSWTLDETVATWFAKRYQTPGQVWKSTIPQNEIIDYLTQRNEEEILVNYKGMNKQREVRRDV